MVKCPNCGTIIKNKVYGCSRGVTKNRFVGSRMIRFEKSLLGKFSEAEEDFKKLMEKHQNFEPLKTTAVNNELGWKSQGDLARDFLDLNICLGYLEKTEFNPNKGGHTWVKTEIRQPCPLRKEETIKSEQVFVCKCTNWIDLGEKRHSE